MVGNVYEWPNWDSEKSRSNCKLIPLYLVIKFAKVTIPMHRQCWWSVSRADGFEGSGGICTLKKLLFLYTAGNIFPLDFNLEQRIQNLALSIHLYWVLTLKIFWILCASFWIDNDQNCWIKDPIIGSQIQNIWQF